MLQVPGRGLSPTGGFPLAAFAATLMVMFCEPEATVNGEEGEIVAPIGSPVMLTVTDPEKSLSGAIET